MDRTERLLDLVALLLASREPVPFAEIRELFPDYAGARDAAERKFERDKAELLQIGVPLEYVPPDPDEDRLLGGYRIDRGAFFLRDPKLTPEEAAALYAAGSAALELDQDFPFGPDLLHALQKLAAGGVGAGGASAARRLLIVRPGDPARAGKLKVLAGAVAQKKRVRIAYRSATRLGPDGEPERTERSVDPFGLAFRGGAWRLVAHDHFRRALRVFVVDRIESLQVNAEHPNVADFDIPAGFDAGKAAGQRPWEWSYGESLTADLRFASGSELLAERAFDAPAHDGTLRLKVNYLDGLVRHVLSFGDRVWIDGPPLARERAEAALRMLVERHAGEPSGPPSAPPPPRKTDPPPPRLPVATDRRERLRRLLLVVPAARRRPGIKVDDLAKELGLDPAELLADIDLLGCVGRPPFAPDDLIDISVDDHGRVSVALDQSFSRPPQLTALEALALAAAAQEVAPADPAVVSALARLTDQLPTAAQQIYAALKQRVASAAPPPTGTDALLAQLRSAAERRREVILDYDKEGRGADEERLLWPLAVLDHGGRWYVVGHDAGRGAERTFRLDRIRALRESGQSFPDPGPIDPARFQRPELYFPSGTERPVVIRFSTGAVPWALWRFGGRAAPLASGGADVSIHSAGTQWAVSLALSFAGEAEILAPAEARAALREEAARALARYAP